ncbi:hypothetical protein CF319_g9045 [Tilletia indica]|uniref:NAD(P)-binding protein n=1 Tax=Tilletia indica TaxID=43049 RepID=A0A177TGW8_9BASI|nr:hypothetical protein CF319_g9045 [Tilletia indica]KAE8249696.1 hypothetical protein A4X13_0g5111 [Tilletia indica]
MSLKGRVAFITGASRGIGLELGLALARRGASVAVAAKTSDPHPKLPGTIHTAAEEISVLGEQNGTGAKGLAIQMDVRNENAVESAIERTVQEFGGLDIVINNASAISMKPTLNASVKSYDLMNSINARGSWLVSRFALPHLLDSASKSRNPHILTLSPPLNYGMLDSPSLLGGGSHGLTKKVSPGDVWPSQYAQTASAYTIAKFGMSLNTLALAAELRGKVGVNALWPYTLIGTSAMKIVAAGSGTVEEAEKKWRSPEIVAEAGVRILEEDGTKFTSQWVIDEIYLRRQHGFSDADIAKFSMGGPDTPLEALEEDLYISQELRDDIRAARAGQ